MKLNKVLYLLDVFPATSETFVINEIIEVQNQGVHVDVFARKCSDEGDVHSLTRKLKGDLHYWKNPKEISLLEVVSAHFKLLLFRFPFYITTLIHALLHNKNGYFYHFKISGFYAAQLLNKRYDHLHAHFISYAAITTMFISRILNIPYTATGHGWHDVYEGVIPFFKLVGDHAKKLITISEYNRDFIVKEHGVRVEQIEIIHCGLDMNLFHHENKKNSPVEILSVARLHPIKGVVYLIRACGLLKEKGLKFHCSIIGEGEQRQEIEGLIKELGLKDYVELLGAKPADEVRRYYAVSDIYVLSSLCEGLPVVVMEAMASSLPIVATHVTGIAELVEDGVNGFLVPVEDVGFLAQRLEILIEDKVKRNTFAEQNRAKVMKLCALKTEVSKLISVWERGRS